MKYQCIALDFDDTLAYFSDKREGLWQIFRDLGFSDAQIQEAYEMSRKQYGHLGSSLIEELSKIKDVREMEPAVIEKVNEWAQTEVRLFDDVMPVIAKLEKDYATVIVTAGFTGLQKIKLMATPLKALKVIVTEGSKVTAIKELLERFGSPILFVDDKPSVFEDLVKNGITQEEVTMVQISRDGAFQRYSTENDFKQVVSLSEILDYI